MNVKETIKHVGANTKQVFVDLKNDVGDALKNFKAAPGKEKTWVLFKTFCVAVACGLITFALATLLAATPVGQIALPIAAFVAGGVNAFYRYSRDAKGPNKLMLDQAVNDAKKGLEKAKEVINNVLDKIPKPKEA